MLENMGTIIVSLALAALVAAIVRKLYMDRKRGRSYCGCSCGCSGGCGCCPMSGSCHDKGGRAADIKRTQIKHKTDIK